MNMKHTTVHEIEQVRKQLEDFFSRKDFNGYNIQFIILPVWETQETMVSCVYPAPASDIKFNLEEFMNYADKFKKDNKNIYIGSTIQKMDRKLKLLVTFT